MADAAIHKEALARIDYARGLPHQIAKATEVVPSKCQGDAETKGVAACLVIGSISFSGFNLWNFDLTTIIGSKCRRA